MAGSVNPVELGLVASLARPGGNVTGVTNSTGEFFLVKQLQLLKEAAPRISRVAVLMTSLREDCGAPVGEGVEIEPDWGISAPIAPDYQADSSASVGDYVKSG